MASPENKCLSVEESAFRIIGEIHRHSILPTPIVGILKPLSAHGYELTLVVGSSRRLGIPFHHSRPEHIALAMPHTVDVALKFLIAIKRSVGNKSVILSIGYIEKMFPSVFSVLGRLKQCGKHMSLHCLALVVIPLQLLLSRHEKFAYNTSQTHYSSLLNVQK